MQNSELILNEALIQGREHRDNWSEAPLRYERIFVSQAIDDSHQGCLNISSPDSQKLEDSTIEH